MCWNHDAMLSSIRTSVDYYLLAVHLSVMSEEDSTFGVLNIGGWSHRENVQQCQAWTMNTR